MMTKLELNQKMVEDVLTLVNASFCVYLYDGDTY